MYVTPKIEKKNFENQFYFGDYPLKIAFQNGRESKRIIKKVLSSKAFQDCLKSPKYRFLCRFKIK